MFLQTCWYPQMDGRLSTYGSNMHWPLAYTDTAFHIQLGLIPSAELLITYRALQQAPMALPCSGTIHGRRVQTDGTGLSFCLHKYQQNHQGGRAPVSLILN